ncbi:hypothetical protein WBJ53_18960 [Spirosoma sp. SC4-14]|uniref:hypothetical protein n=1 Tax=Spirosoma sp. SC4-14 TaxID=3128900 RepID=UPI0030D5CE2D
MMSYKGFSIEVQTIESCTLNSQTNTLYVVGIHKVYRIKDSVSNLVYDVKRSVEAARKAIDKNGARWRAR